MSKRLLRWLYRFFTMTACGLFLAAGYLYLEPPPAPALHVVGNEFKISNAYAGETRYITFQLDNHSSKPIRVVGLTGC